MFLECEDIFPWFNGIENNIVSKLFKVNYLNTSVWFEILPFDNIFCCKLIDVGILGYYKTLDPAKVEAEKYYNTYKVEKLCL